MDEIIFMNNNQQAEPFFYDIANYICNKTIDNSIAISTAKLALMDAISCALQALKYPEATKHLGSFTEAYYPIGSRVLGTKIIVDPIKATYDNGILIRWLDYNDTWLAKEWGHPSDNLAAILSVADYLSQIRVKQGKLPFLMHEILLYLIKAYEIQGIIALENSFNEVGIDHVILVKLASTAVVTHMLGGGQQDIVHAMTQVFVNGNSLRTYRHFPNTGHRKSWAAGNAASEAVKLSWLTMLGEEGYYSVLTDKNWGFYKHCFNNKKFVINRDYDSYVMENIMFKISSPAEFHAQTALEAAIILHKKYINKIHNIKKIQIETTAAAIKIISKKGKLRNSADRDHCLEYIVAIGLIYGELSAKHYSEEIAINDLIDILREKMVVSENKQFTNEYYHEDKRSVANAVQIEFNDNTKSEKIVIEFPIGHKARRKESLHLLERKFIDSIYSIFSAKKCENILNLFKDVDYLSKISINEFMSHLSL